MQTLEARQHVTAKLRDKVACIQQHAACGVLLCFPSRLSHARMPRSCSYWPAFQAMNEGKYLLLIDDIDRLLHLVLLTPAHSGHALCLADWYPGGAYYGSTCERKRNTTRGKSMQCTGHGRGDLLEETTPRRNPLSTPTRFPGTPHLSSRDDALYLDLPGCLPWPHALGGPAIALQFRERPSWHLDTQSVLTVCHPVLRPAPRKKHAMPHHVVT